MLCDQGVINHRSALFLLATIQVYVVEAATKFMVLCDNCDVGGGKRLCADDGYAPVLIGYICRARDELRAD